jgi:hypothetical protein
VLASVIRTCEKQGHDFIALTGRILRTGGRAVLELLDTVPDPPAPPVDQAHPPPLLPAPKATARSSPA